METKPNTFFTEPHAASLHCGLYKKLITILSFVFLCVFNSNAQVTVSGSTGANGSTYTTLKSAFDAINSNATQTGNNIIITLTANTTETASAVLNAGNWNSLKIYPTVTGVTITGNLAAPLINLNGADNVTLDGRVNATGSTRSLTIVNTNTGTTDGTSTIRFINGATNNAVQYCYIKGSSLVADASNYPASGTVFFSTTTSTGNSNNVIDNNEITQSSAGMPNSLICFAGTAGNVNSANTISNNNLFNVTYSYYSSLVYFKSNTSSCIVTGNSFYDNTLFISKIFKFIWITDGNSYNINGNYFGGTAPGCSGSKLSINIQVSSIDLAPASGGTPTIFQNNTVKYITFPETVGSGISILLTVTGTGSVNILSNTFGSTTENSTITYSGANNLVTYLIGNQSTGSVLIDGNSIGGIYLKGTQDQAMFSFTAIVGGTATITNNLIGSTTMANSINNDQLGTSWMFPNTLTGIQGGGLVSNNIICNLTHGGQGTYYSYASNNPNAIIGISSATTVTNNTISNLRFSNATGAINFIRGILSCKTVSNNIIHDFSVNSTYNTINSSGSSSEYGDGTIEGIIGGTGGTGGIVSNNTVYNLTNTNTSVSGRLIGIRLISVDAAKNFVYGLTTSSPNESLIGLTNVYNSTSGTCTNNIISLSSSISNHLYGIWATGTASTPQILNIYFNTIYIGGSQSTNFATSYAFYDETKACTRDIRNNLFFNARSNTGSTIVSNYAVSIAEIASLTMDFNDYYSSDNGGMLGILGVRSYDTLSAWQTVTFQDANSKNINPNIVSPGATTANSYAPGASGLVGVSGTGIDTDYFGATRAIPTMGAIEQVAPVVTTQAVSNINNVSAIGNGTIVTLGMPVPILEYGVCWSSTNGTPTVSDNRINNGTISSVGAFIAAMASLAPRTKYYVRAYVSNNPGSYQYGNTVTFVTGGLPLFYSIP